MTIYLHHLLNLDAVRKLCESMYREGFSDGADYGNLDWKYPPEDVAWLLTKTQNPQLFGDKAILTKEEAKQLEAWNGQSYKERIDRANSGEYCDGA